MHVEDPASDRFLDRHYFLLRRLHSLTGVVPLGVFLFPHLMTNSSIVWGRYLGHARYGDGGVETFQHEVSFIHSLPMLIFIEVCLLWLPIAFHGGLGIVFAATGKVNLDRYHYQGNWRYTLQRLTGYIGIAYLFVHIASLRWGWDLGGLFKVFVADRAASTTAAHMQQSPLGVLVPLFYLVGMLALVYHFANGLWTAAITWGLTISTTAQRRWAYVCVVVGLFLGAAGVAGVVGFWTLDVEQARAVETMLHRSAEPAGVADLVLSEAEPN